MRNYRYLQKGNHLVCYDSVLLSIGCLQVSHVKVAPQGSHPPRERTFKGSLWPFFRYSELEQGFCRWYNKGTVILEKFLKRGKNLLTKHHKCEILQLLKQMIKIHLYRGVY